MSKPEKASVTTMRQQLILDALQDGARTWDELRTRTNVRDENLGYALGELLDLRKIWTVARGDLRVYGVERRTDLIPRFSQPRRRLDDPRTA